MTLKSLWKEISNNFLNNTPQTNCIQIMSRRFLFALTLLFGSILACNSTKSVVTPPSKLKSLISLERPIPNPIELPSYFLNAVKKGTRTTTGAPGEYYWTQYADYQLNAVLSPKDTTLKGSAIVTYYNNSPDNLPIVVFELAQNLHKKGAPRLEAAEVTGGMQIHSVSINGREVSLTTQPRFGTASYGIQGTNMFVMLNEPLISGGNVSIEIDYSFKIPKSGASARMGYDNDNLFYLGYWYPHVSVYDDLEGWFGDTFTGNAEFYHDFSDYDITITAPQDWVIMSTGEFINPEETLAPEILTRYEDAINSDTVTTIISENDFGMATLSNSSGKLEWKFRAENVRDVSFSATKESIWDGTRALVGDLDDDGDPDYARINAFWRTSAPKWKESARFAQHSISYFSRFTGISYPWPHMTTVEGEGIIGGGMEFPMMTIIGAYNNRTREALYDVTAHELAHMWMPMIVSSNERRRAWMDEGSTTFHEANARWDFFKMDEDLATEYTGFLRISGSYREGEVMRYSDYHYSSVAYGIASYTKPASILFTLRGVLGEDLFMKAWTTYISSWAYKHPTPYDLFNTFEDVTGKDLDWFWRSWYFETWELDQAIDDVTLQADSVTISIKDIGNIPMPVDLTLFFEDGTEVETRIGVDEWLLGKRTLSITLPINSPLLEVTIDKTAIFPDVNRSNNTWKKH